MTSIANILLRHNYIDVPKADSFSSNQVLATVVMNISYYGFALSTEAFKALQGLNANAVNGWWEEIEKELKSITGDDRNIADFVVYKNFPAEVLEKTEAEYMYWGYPKEFFTQEVKPREKMNEQPKAIVLRRAKKDTLQNILDSYVASPARWKEQEFKDVLTLSESFSVNFAKFGFKENLVRLASFFAENGRKININTATDVLRLAAGLSDGDVSLREIRG